MQVATTADTLAGRRLQSSPNRFGQDPARHARTQSVLDGKMRFYDRRRGFGFIAHDGHGDGFVHRSQVAGVGARELRGGQLVRFEVGCGPKGDEARKVRVV